MDRSMPALGVCKETGERCVGLCYISVHADGNNRTRHAPDLIQKKRKATCIEMPPILALKRLSESFPNIDGAFMVSIWAKKKRNEAVSNY